MLARVPRACSEMVEATCCLVIVRLLFVRFGYARLAPRFGRACAPAEGLAQNAALDMDLRDIQRARRVSRAIARAHAVVRTTCLMQAIAARSMLRRRGIGSVMMFGVDNAEGVRTAGNHAWLVSGPVRVSGFPQARAFRPFAAYVDRPGEEAV